MKKIVSLLFALVCLISCFAPMTAIAKVSNPEKNGYKHDSEKYPTWVTAIDLNENNNMLKFFSFEGSEQVNGYTKNILIFSLEKTKNISDEGDQTTEYFNKGSVQEIEVNVSTMLRNDYGYRGSYYGSSNYKDGIDAAYSYGMPYVSMYEFEFDTVDKLNAWMKSGYPKSKGKKICEKYVPYGTSAKNSGINFVFKHCVGRIYRMEIYHPIPEPWNDGNSDLLFVNPETYKFQEEAGGRTSNVCPYTVSYGLHKHSLQLEETKDIDGVQTSIYKCSLCNYSENKPCDCEHPESARKNGVIVPSTYTETGIKGDYCSACMRRFSTSAVPKKTCDHARIGGVGKFVICYKCLQKTTKNNVYSLFNNRQLDNSCDHAYCCGRLINKNGSINKKNVIKSTTAINSVYIVKRKTIIKPKYFKKGKVKYSCKYCGRVYFTQKAKKSVTVKKPSVSGNIATIKWKKVPKAKGYEIQYSTNKSFKKKTVVNVESGAKRSIEISVPSNTKTYIRVRAYTKKGGKKVYSAWSKKKTVKP